MSQTNPPPIPQVPGRGQSTEAARQQRLSYLEQATGLSLEDIRRCSLSPERLSANVENLIGSVEIPVGLAGPLLFDGEEAKGLVHLPMATTEGALVASVTRGSRAMSLSGGVHTRVVAQRMIRAPLFVTDSVRSAMRLADWMRDHSADIRARTEQVSAHARFLSVEPSVSGASVHARFVYSTGDAAGQNMTTACTWHASQWILDRVRDAGIDVRQFFIEGNLSGDKKVNFNSFVGGRGTRVVAGCFIDDETLRQVLKISALDLVRTNHRGTVGAIKAGMVGYNINVANVVAAAFTACGQDIACTHESSLGVLDVEEVDGGVYASMLLPSLVVGTVGGGTHLPGQRELLTSLGCFGRGRAGRFAEIVAGFALALDLSTLAAVGSGQFASAHERLGRNRPVEYFRRADLDEERLTSLMAAQSPGARATQVRWTSSEPLAGGIANRLGATRTEGKIVGLYPLDVVIEDNGERRTRKLIANFRPLDQETILGADALAAMCGPEIRDTHGRFKHRTGFARSHVRELALYRLEEPALERLRAPSLGVIHDHAREAHIVIMDDLRGIDLLDSADDLEGWTPEHIDAALRGIGAVHGAFLEQRATWSDWDWLDEPVSPEEMESMAPLWTALGRHAYREFPEWLSREDLLTLQRSAGHAAEWWGRMQQMPQTLVHGDFNPRNMGFVGSGDDLRPLVYDWELSRIGIPQRDLAELLAFTLHPEVSAEEVWHHVEVHRVAVSEASGRELDAATWREGFGLALRDFLVTRVSLYAAAHTFCHYPFMERVAPTTRRLIELAAGAES